MQHPFRTLPEGIDTVVCGRCGHPVWDHCVSDTCAECESRYPGTACQVFSLAGFTEVRPTTYEEYAVRR